MANPQISVAQSDNTLMFAEAAEAGAAIRRQITRNNDKFARIADRLRTSKPVLATTIGRGSSDHACVYAKYLLEIELGVITSPAGLSVNSIYNTSLSAENSLCIAISQSGQSPDLVSAVAAIRKAGAFVVALVNVEDSPLAAAADEIIPLQAGPEKSVAATKSFITALAAIAQLVAHWKDDRELLDAITKLPDQLESAWDLDWRNAAEAFIDVQSMFVLGRGVGYGVAREAALKFKETCSIHAEAYSAAEVLHGPAALIADGFPVLAFSQNDETQSSMRDTLGTLAARGANVFACGVNHPSINNLPAISAHPILEPILMTQSFYKLVNAVSIARGLDPDRPPHLSKVTETV